MSNRSLRSSRENILAELSDVLNKRQNNEPENSRSKPKPHPPLKGRSESLVDVHKYKITAPHNDLTQSLSVASNMTVVQSDVVTRGNHRSHTKSLPKSHTHTTVGPPPSRPPPTLTPDKHTKVSDYFLAIETSIVICSLQCVTIQHFNLYVDDKCFLEISCAIVSS